MKNQKLIYAVVTFLCVIALTVLAVIYYFRGDITSFIVFLVVAVVSVGVAAHALYTYLKERKKGNGGKK